MHLEFDKVEVKLRLLVIIYVVLPAAALMLLVGMVAAQPFEDVPAQLRLHGQAVTCSAPRHKTFNFTIEDNSLVALSPDVSMYVYTFNHEVPGPVVEVCQGDTVELIVTNHGNMEHGLDTHAFRIDPARFGSMAPDEVRTIEAVTERPGVFMLHCGAGAMTDMHIKMGMYTAMIVYPRQTLAPAKELVVIQGAAFGSMQDERGHSTITPEQKRMLDNQPTYYFYNGSFEHKPFSVKVGDRVRVYFLNTAPGISSVHVIGDILDVAHEGGNPRNAVYDVQSFPVADGDGAIVEFTIPATGTYLLVDHDHLSQLKWGMALKFAAK